jgi:parvulin-like peptidyl-prolyl isomerase
VGGIRTFLVERIMSNIIPLEMKRSNIENDPEIKAVMQGKLEELMINRLWDDMINSQTVVTEKMIREYYNEHIDDFGVPEKRRFGVIITGDVAEAQKAYDEIQSGTLFRTVAMAYSIDETTKRTLGETELITQGEQPEMDEVGFALSGVGAVSEPFETSRGWAVIKVTETEEAGSFSFEQARLPIQGALKEEINDDRLNEFLEKWKEELNVTIFEDNLEKIQVVERIIDATKK